MADMEWMNKAENLIRRHDQQGQMDLADGLAHDFLHKYGDKLTAAVRLAEREIARAPFMRLPYDANRIMRDLLDRLRSGEVEEKP